MEEKDKKLIDGMIDQAAIAGSFNVPETVQMSLKQLPKDCELWVEGVAFEGIDAIREYMWMQTDSSQPYIVECCKRFPCFDSSDYAYENRYYRNFLFCRSKQDANNKAMKMKQQREGNNFCLVNNTLPADMRPMLYYQDEDKYMLLAY